MMWILVSLVVVALVLLLVRATKGPAYSMDTLGTAIKGLLRQGYNGGFLLINVPYSRRFLQLTKYIRAPGEYGIELAFPKAKWSEQYYPEVRKLCDENGLPCRVSPAGVGDPLEFLFVNFETDHGRAHLFVRRVLTEIFRIPENATLYCRLERATPEDRLVDR